MRCSGDMAPTPVTEFPDHEVDRTLPINLCAQPVAGGCAGVGAERGADAGVSLLDGRNALGAIDGLKDALTRLRKFGGRCVLGFQSVSQLNSTYGADAHTIIENCGNTLILRCSGSENGGTSQYAARLIGDREVIRRQRSRGRDNPGALLSGGARRSTQISDQRLVEPAVLAAQVEQLPDLAGYLKIASSPVWQAVRIGRQRHGDLLPGR
jgi:hypothetical protein